MTSTTHRVDAHTHTMSSASHTHSSKMSDPIFPTYHRMCFLREAIEREPPSLKRVPPLPLQRHWCDEGQLGAGALDP